MGNAEALASGKLKKQLVIMKSKHNVLVTCRVTGLVTL